jgi:asparagine synthase (glutamine-hydrolysing)
MCGIFGQLNWQGADAALIERMAQRLAHRGPDGYSVHDAGVLAFGAGRLAIIDLSAPSGVVFNEDRRISLVFNGEIYNYRGLRAELEQAGHHFYTHTDTEVIVHGYEQWGIGVIERLRGMFAIGLWDANQESLLLVRDRAGEKPLYYAELDHGELLFASESKALFEHAALRPTVNHAALPYYLTLGYTPPPMTLFAGIRKLAAGELLRVNRQGVQVERYWTPTAHPAQNQRPIPVAQVREAVVNAVESRLISDVPVGAFLSGGVDSSATVAIMQRAMQQPLQTFTVGFDFPAGSAADAKFNVDVQYAQLAARHIGTQHQRITILEEHLATIVPHLVYQMDEPIAQHSIVQTMYVAALARHRQVPVLLSGDAGDELFLGYEHYRADQQLARFLALPALLRENVLVPLMGQIGRGRDFLRKTRNTTPSARYLEWMRFLDTAEAAQLLPQGDAAQVAQQLAALLDPLLAQPDAQHFAERIAYTSLRLWIPEDSNMRVDKMSMLMSIESRAPLEDQHLIELALNIPLADKLRGGQLKALFKAAVREWLPPAILNRPKWGFIPPTSDWLRTCLRPLVERYLSAEYVTAAGMVRYEPVQALVQAHLSKQGYHLKPLWALLVLHLWHALYISGDLRFGAQLTPADVVGMARVE